MPQSKHEIQAMLSSAGTEPRKRFGQNFMIDQNLVRLVAEAGSIGSSDVVIEVGPGTGTLSEELLPRCRGLVLVEIDRDLTALLRERFAPLEDTPTFLRMLEYPEASTTANSTAESEHIQGKTDRNARGPRVLLIEGDAMAGKHGLSVEVLNVIGPARRAGHVVKLVANLPYNIASPLVIEMLLAGVGTLAFTVQKEVADRLRAKESQEEYGALSIMAQLLARVEVLRTLPPQVFWPAPGVDSALVRMVRDDRLGDRARDFSRFLQRMFSSRRKTLRRALAQAGFDAEPSLQTLSIDSQLRPENLTPQQWLVLFDAVSSTQTEG